MAIKTREETLITVKSIKESFFNGFLYFVKTFSENSVLQPKPARIEIENPYMYRNLAGALNNAKPGM